MLNELASVRSWHEAIKRAKALVREGKLNAITAVTEEEYDADDFAIFLLEELRVRAGSRDLERVLDIMEFSYVIAYGERDNLMLYHGPHRFQTNSGEMDSWLLVIIY